MVASASTLPSGLTARPGAGRKNRRFTIATVDSRPVDRSNRRTGVSVSVCWLKFKIIDGVSAQGPITLMHSCRDIHFGAAFHGDLPQSRPVLAGDIV